MEFNVTCPKCAKRLGVPEEKVGHKVRCSGCKVEFRVSESPAKAGGNMTRGDLPGGNPLEAHAQPEIGDLRPGDRFADRFTIKRKLGSGTFGTVYRAFDEPFYRVVALKIPSDDIRFNERFMERFRAEAKILEQLHHPNIVAYYDAQLDRSPRFLAAEFVDGRDLEQEFEAARSNDGWFDLPRAVWIVHELAGALHHAHLMHVIHRDVKPANILIRGDIVKLTDFGLARFGDPRLTTAGAKIGTPFYMSPEQVNGDPAQIDARSDQYALGVVLYELLCNRRPFVGPSAESIYPQILNKQPPNPKRHVSSIPSDLADICLKALAKNPDSRWPDCAEFASALRYWLPDDPGPTPDRIAKWVEPKAPAPPGPSITDRQSPAKAAVPEMPAAPTETAPRVVQAAPRQNSQSSRNGKTTKLDPLKSSLKETARTIKSGWPLWVEWCLGWLTYWVDRLNANLSKLEPPAPAGSLADDGLVTEDNRPEISTEHELPTGEVRGPSDAASAVVSHARSVSNAGPGSGPIPLVSTREGSGTRVGAGRTNPVVSKVVVAESRDYYQELTGAHAAWREHRRQDACHQLDRCDPEVRGWEWAYLQALCRLPITTFSDHAGEVGAIAFDRSGRLLAAGEEGGVRVWDTSARRLVCRLRIHLKRVDTVAFSPTGRWLAFSGGKSIRVSDLEAQRPDESTQVLQGHESMVNRLAFASDGVHLASAGLDQSVRIWNVLEGRERLALKGRAGPVHALAFHPHDPELLLSAHNSGTIVLWDWVEACERRRSSARSSVPIDILAVHPSGGILATGSRDGRITFWNIDSLEPIANVAAHVDAVSSLDFHPNGRWIASLGGGKDRSLRIGKADPNGSARELGREVAVVPFDATTLSALAFSPTDDGRLALAGGRDQTVKLWDGSTFWKSLASGGDGDRVRAVAIHPGGSHRAVARMDNAIEVRSLTRTTPPRVFPGRGIAIHALAFHPHQPDLVSAGDDGALTFWDLVGGEPAARLAAHPRAVLALAFDPDGRLLATAGADGAIRLWDAQSHQPIRTLAGHGDKMATSIAFVFDRRELRLCSGGDDRFIHIWDIRTGQCLDSLEGHKHRVIALATTADGHRLISLGTDRVLNVWALDQPNPVLDLPDVDILAGLAWHRKASVLAAVSEDRSLILETLPLPRGEED